jgi:hypothetical protein
MSRCLNLLAFLYLHLHVTIIPKKPTNSNNETCPKLRIYITPIKRSSKEHPKLHYKFGVLDMSRCLNLLAFLYLHLHVTIILDIHSLLQHHPRNIPNSITISTQQAYLNDDHRAELTDCSFADAGPWFIRLFENLADHNRLDWASTCACGTHKGLEI